MVFGKDGGLDYVLGSPGGPGIILFNLKTIFALLDWRMDAAEAAALVNFGSTPGRGPDRARRRRGTTLAAGLAAKGHKVRRMPIDQRRAHHRRDARRARRRRRPAPRRRGARGLDACPGLDRRASPMHPMRHDRPISQDRHPRRRHGRAVAGAHARPARPRRDALRALGRSRSPRPAAPMPAPCSRRAARRKAPSRSIRELGKRGIALWQDDLSGHHRQRQPRRRPAARPRPARPLRPHDQGRRTPRRERACRARACPRPALRHALFIMPARRI